MRLLLVEDDADLADTVAEMLREESYAVDLARDGPQADELVAANDYDAVVLDWSIPGPTGVELLRAWRGGGLTMPVLMLTGRAAIEDRVGGLDAGADDYLTKPFAFDELLARVRSLLRRASSQPELRELRAGSLRIDRPTRTVHVGRRHVDLSPKEFALLEYLLLHKDEVVSRKELTDHVWDDAFDPRGNVVNVTIHRLRRKIDGHGSKRRLHTVAGAGYVLRSDPA